MTTKDENKEPELEDVLTEAFKAMSAEHHTGLPGRVLSYDKEDQRARVRPVVEFRYIDPETDEEETYLPNPISDVPVRFPSGHGVSITWPLTSGSRVWLQAAERSIDEHLTEGADDNEPSDPRRFDLSDVIAIPGRTSFALSLDETHDSAMVIGLESGFELHLSEADPDDWMALAGPTDNRLEALHDKLNALITAFQGHLHSAGDLGSSTQKTGGPLTTPPTQLGPFASVKSDKVRSE